MKYRPKAIDLFCGCGGLTEGLRQAGFDVIGAIDVDEVAVETYRANHVDGTRSGRSVREVWCKPIQKLEPEKLMEDLSLESGDLDLLAGCPPCQGFSSLRTLNGKYSYKKDKDKNDLVYQYLRYAKALRPKTLMMENVPGLAQDKRMSHVLMQLHDMGYKVDPAAPSQNVRVLDAADYGVPQRRRRTVLLAALNGKVSFAAKSADRKTVEHAIKNIEGKIPPEDPVHYHGERRSDAVMARIEAVPKDGGSLREAGDEHQLACHKDFDGFKDVYGRLAWENVSSTITSGCTNPSKGRFLHPEKNRALTLREAAALQSFPPDYYFSLKRGKNIAARMIGDALPPEFVRRHASSLIEVVTDHR